MHLKYSLGTKEQMVSRPNEHFVSIIIINSVSNIARNIKLLTITRVLRPVILMISGKHFSCKSQCILYSVFPSVSALGFPLEYQPPP